MRVDPGTERPERLNSDLPHESWPSGARARAARGHRLSAAFLPAGDRTAIGQSRALPMGRTTDADRPRSGHDDGTLGTVAPDWRSILMTTTRVDVIDRSVEKTHIWLDELSEELGTDDRHHAYRVLRAFLHALRDHLPVDEAAALAAQLPIFVERGLLRGLGSQPHPRSRARPRQLFAADRGARRDWPARRRRRSRPGPRAGCLRATSPLARREACCACCPSICVSSSARRRRHRR